jgi:hypothetical protein
MHRGVSIALAAVAVLGASCALAQQPEFATRTAAHRVTWSFDPVQGVMQATLPSSYVIQGRPEPSLAAASTTAPTTYTGTIDVNFTVKLISAVPKGALLRCSGNVGLEYEVEEKISTLEIGLSVGLLESTENVDAAVSGSTATCKLTIPYSWTVPASTSSSTVTIQEIVGSVGISEDVLDSVTGVNVLRVVRSTSVELAGPTTIPADGTTTTLSASTVL